VRTKRAFLRRREGKGPFVLLSEEAREESSLTGKRGGTLLPMQWEGGRKGDVENKKIWPKLEKGGKETRSARADGKEGGKEGLKYPL